MSSLDLDHAAALIDKARGIIDAYAKQNTHARRTRALGIVTALDTAFIKLEAIIAAEEAQ